MKKKLLALALLAGILCTALTACGGGSTEKPTEDRKATNELVVGIAQDLDDSLDPHKTVKAGTREVMFNVFEGLVKPTTDGDLTPAVAETYTVSEDRLTYTFTLREGVKYHNGDTVTAEDVVYSIERCAAAEETGIVQVEAFSNIAEITGEDRTVVIRLQEPSNEFLSYLTVAILPKDYTEQDTQPVGVGPFKFVSRTAQDNIVLEKFDEYWGTPAKLDKVTLKIVENADSLMLSLQSGAIDLCGHLTSTQVAQLGDDFTVEVDTMKLVQALYLNNGVKPFDDVRVRQAMYYAINVPEVIEFVCDGAGVPTGTSMYPAFKKYFVVELADKYQQDLTKAKQLLAEAGYPNGFTMTITVPGNYEQHVDTGLVLAQQLAAVGITADVQEVAWETWVSDVYKGSQFEATVSGIAASNMTAREMLERYTTGHSKNFIKFSNQEFDDVVSRAMTTMDMDEQVTLYKRAQEILNEQAASLWLQDLCDLVVMNTKLDGMTFYATYVLDMSTIYYK